MRLMRLQRLLLGVMTATALAISVGASQAVLTSGASTFVLPCHTVALMTRVGRGSAAAGTAYETLLIMNRSSHACTLSGIPATQFGNFVGSGGLVYFRGVGPAAMRVTYAGRGKTIVLKPGAVASVNVGIETAANYPRSKCAGANASRVRLIFPSGTTLYYTLRTNEVCTKLASTLTSGVVLGTRFP